jgi:hypothetical protein
MSATTALTKGEGMSFTPAGSHPTRRLDLALDEIDHHTAALAGDVRSLEARLFRAGLGFAVGACPEFRILTTGLEVVAHELAEARVAAGGVPDSPFVVLRIV